MMRRRRRQIAAALLLPAMLWFVWFENNAIVSEQISVELAGLPEQFDGFRIVLLADLHGKTFGKDNRRLLALVRAAQPDLIAICGDLADRREQLGEVAALARSLAGIAPAYYVTGNHEWAAGIVPELTNMLESAGVNVLANEFVRLELDGECVVLAGVHDPNGPYDMLQPAELAAQINRVQPDAPIVMLAHRNDDPAQWDALGIDLVLSGHGHGGVIRLPIVGGLLGSNRTLFPDYTAGLYQSEHTQMVVSRGLGNSGVPLRFMNRPDVPVVILSVP